LLALYDNLKQSHITDVLGKESSKRKRPSKQNLNEAEFLMRLSCFDPEFGYFFKVFAQFHQPKVGIGNCLP
jgi:hypothetical protein